MPGFHGERLAAAAPEKNEVSADDNKQPGLAGMTQGQRVSALGERVEQPVGGKNYAKQQQRFIQHAGKPTFN